MIGMIRYGNGPVSFGDRPLHELRRDQLAVTEDGMCMQINHGSSLQKMITGGNRQSTLPIRPV
jgi:hypothetical protein